MLHQESSASQKGSQAADLGIFKYLYITHLILDKHTFFIIKLTLKQCSVTASCGPHKVSGCSAELHHKRAQMDILCLNFGPLSSAVITVYSIYCLVTELILKSIVPRLHNRLCLCVEKRACDANSLIEAKKIKVGLSFEDRDEAQTRIAHARSC